MANKSKVKILKTWMYREKALHFKMTIKIAEKTRRQLENKVNNSSEKNLRKVIIYQLKTKQKVSKIKVNRQKLNSKKQKKKNKNNKQNASCN